MAFGSNGEAEVRRLLTASDEFEPVGVHELVDSDLEALLKEHAALLYPDFFLVQFRSRVRTELGVVFPHLALIHRQYFEWWFVSLEAGSAPTADDVNEMAQKIRRTTYEREHAKLLCNRESELDEELLFTLMTRESPKLFVVVGNPPVPVTDEAGIRVGVVELFKSRRTGESVLRINGVHPTTPEEELTTCVRDRIMPLPTFKVTDPSKLLGWVNGQLIQVGDQLTAWSKVENGGRTLILPMGDCPLPAGVDSFRLMRAPSGRLRLIAG